MAKPAAPTNVAASEDDSAKVVISWTKSTGATGYKVYRNLRITNASFENWSGGGSVAPDGWILFGTDAEVQRASGTVYSGTYSARIKRNGTNCGLYQKIHEKEGIAAWQGKTVTWREWVYVAKANTARIAIIGDDGTTTYSSYHSGVAGWERLTVTATVGANATYLQLRCQVNTNDVYAYFDYSAGEVLVAEVGNVATANDTSAHAPQITAGSTVASDGTSSEHITLDLSGTSIANGISYSYKVTAVNAEGESGFSSLDSGYRKAGSLSYQWQMLRLDTGTWMNIGTTVPYDYSAAYLYPVITPGDADASDGTSPEYVSLNLSGHSIADGATRTFRCKISSPDAATVYSAEDTGYCKAGTLSYQWQRSLGDSPANYADLAGATTVPYNDTTAPEDGSGRYYQCVLSALGSVDKTSLADRGYKEVSSIPRFMYYRQQMMR